MSAIPAQLRYTKDHEWVQDLGDGTVLVGITDYAQTSLGDVTFVDLPAVGEHFDAGATFGVVESVKAASDLFMPAAGEVVEINEALASSPETVNREPYGAAWMLKVKLDDPAALADLMDAGAYRSIVG